MSLDQYLFGSIVTISGEQVISLFYCCCRCLSWPYLFIRPMYILTFDEDTALCGWAACSVPCPFSLISWRVLIALMIPAAGALLVSTIMVLPASIALRIGKNFKSVILLANAIGFFGMIAGLYISYYAGTPGSASITIIFVNCSCWSIWSKIYEIGQKMKKISLLLAGLLSIFLVACSNQKMQMEAQYCHDFFIRFMSLPSRWLEMRPMLNF